MTEEAPRLPVKIAELTFDDIGYKGFKCRRRLNLTLGTLRSLKEAEDEPAARAGWLEVFPWWNFGDEDGKPIPHTAEGFDLLPDDLWEAMLTKGNDAVKEAAMPSPLDDDSSKPPEEAKS